MSEAAYVFPTCVGVFLTSGSIWGCDVRLPHVRGGVSISLEEITFNCLSSPRAWGCFRWTKSSIIFSCVFPTCVGVFPCRPMKPPTAGSLPHVRGGVSRPPLTPHST